MQNGMGGGIPRVQMPGGPGGAPPAGGGAPPMQGGGMPPMGGGMGGAPGGAGGDPRMKQMIFERANQMTEEEGMALVEALTASPAAAMALKKLIPELSEPIDMLMQSGAGGQGGAPGVPPPPGGMSAGAMPSMGGGGGMPPPAGPSTRLGSI